MFSQVRGLGRYYDHPTPTLVKHRFRLLLIERNSVELGNASVQKDTDFETDDFVTVDFVSHANLAMTGEIAAAELHTDNDDDTLAELSADDVMAVLNDIEHPHTITGTTADSQVDKMTVYALRYIAGWVAFKFRKEHRNLGSVVTSSSMSATAVAASGSSWLQSVSRGGLREPSAEWFSAVLSMESGK